MTHLAIGDFVYQRAFLHAFKQRHPNLQLDIWIDDCRTRSKSWHVGRNCTLVQWLASEDYIQQIYPIASSAQHRGKLLSDARACHYDLIIFNASQRAEQYAKFARQIGPDAFIIGTKPNHFSLRSWWYFRQINKYYLDLPNAPTKHISQHYQDRFHALLGIKVDEKQRLYPITIPREFQDKADKFLTKSSHQIQRTIFINHLSTTIKRDYSWEKLRALLLGLADIHPLSQFIVNTPPAQYAQVCQQLKEDDALRTLDISPFTATHFFELPAIINASDLIITVETAIMHIASSLHKKQIVLMRESAKAWAPLGEAYILYGGRRVDSIEVSDVLRVAAQI